MVDDINISETEDDLVTAKKWVANVREKYADVINFEQRQKAYKQGLAMAMDTEEKVRDKLAELYKEATTRGVLIYRGAK